MLFQPLCLCEWHTQWRWCHEGVSMDGSVLSCNPVVASQIKAFVRVIMEPIHSLGQHEDVYVECCTLDFTSLASALKSSVKQPALHQHIIWCGSAQHWHRLLIDWLIYESIYIYFDYQEGLRQVKWLSKIQILLWSFCCSVTTQITICMDLRFPPDILDFTNPTTLLRRAVSIELELKFNQRLRICIYNMYSWMVRHDLDSCIAHPLPCLSTGRIGGTTAPGMKPETFPGMKSLTTPGMTPFLTPGVNSGTTPGVETEGNTVDMTMACGETPLLGSTPACNERLQARGDVKESYT